MNLLNDIYRFLSILNFVDLVFFWAIIILIILLVVLVYFIKINKEVLTEDDFFPPENNYENKEEEKNNINVLEIKEKESKPTIEEIYNDEEGELLDLKGLTEKLQQEESERITCTEYEKDQEEKAIISYDELLQKHNKYAVNYEKEEVIDDLIVKKVNLNDLVNKNSEEIIETEARAISYQKEEDFLKALKELNSLLN